MKNNRCFRGIFFYLSAVNKISAYIRDESKQSNEAYERLGVKEMSAENVVKGVCLVNIEYS